MSGYYLKQHPNRHGPHYYESRKEPVLAIVMHVTAGLQGRPDAADSSAERTAQYAATTDRPVSWHSSSDTDSHFLLLPDTATAFHCQGYNSCTVGHEISKGDVSWSDESPQWVTETLGMAVASLRPRAAALRVPIRRATRAELDAARDRYRRTGKAEPVGFLAHGDLDPDRRSDPGPDFPWSRFFDLLTPDSEDPDMPLSDQDVAKVAKAAAELVRKDIVTLLRGSPNHPHHLTSIGEKLDRLVKEAGA